MHFKNAEGEHLQHGAHRRGHVGFHRVQKRADERNGLEQYLPQLVRLFFPFPLHFNAVSTMLKRNNL